MTRPVLLLGYAHGPAGDRAVRVAADLASRLGVDLHVVHVVDSRDYPVDPDAADFDTEAERRLADQHDRVEALLRRAGHAGAGYSQDTVRGAPVAALAAAADAVDAFMIVVGSRGEGPGSALARLVEPSVSHGLIGHQSRPVLVVPAGAG